MSIVIIPSTGPQTEADPVGKLAGTLLSVSVAGLADPSRFRRGKTYVLEHAVTRLEISPGILRASVTGSRAQPYQATIAVDLVAPPPDLGARLERHQVSRLTPQAHELIASCTCPDFDDPCKHAVAAVLQLARELAERPELLLEWRGATRDAPARAQVGSRASGERHLRIVPPPQPSPFSTPEWREFEGVDLPTPVVAMSPDLLPPVEPGPGVIDKFDVGAMVRSALHILRAPR